MRAIALDGFGGPEVLRWVEVEDPVAGPSQVLVDIVASGVNRADVLQREGNYPPPAGDPLYPGLELSGRVAAVGVGVSGFAVDDPVCALVGGGGYAEKVAAPAAQVLYRTEECRGARERGDRGSGVDVILDLVGGSALEGNIRSLATKGRLVAVGVLDGQYGRLDLVELITRRRSILTLSLRRMASAEKAAVIASVREHVWPLIEAGAVRSVVDRRISLRDAARAHRIMEAGEHFGKIVLVTGRDDAEA